jgi:hypothetical protein
MHTWSYKILIYNKDVVWHVSYISPYKFTFVFLTGSILDAQCMLSYMFYSSLYPLYWVTTPDGIILWVLHLSWAYFILLLINYKQNHVRICVKGILGNSANHRWLQQRVRLNMSHDSSIFISLIKMSQSNTDNIKFNFKATHRYSEISIQCQGYSQ